MVAAAAADDEDTAIKPWRIRESKTFSISLSHDSVKRERGRNQPLPPPVWRANKTQGRATAKSLSQISLNFNSSKPNIENISANSQPIGN